MGKKIKQRTYTCLPELVSGSIHSATKTPNTKKHEAQAESLDPGSESGTTSIIDISWPISPGMTTYKNKGGVSFTPTKTFASDGARETALTIPSHNGTHIDAPSHFIENGASIDHCKLASLVGPCIVLDLTHVHDHISKNDISGFSIHRGAIVLLKTKNSASLPTDTFDSSCVYLDQSGAQHLVDCGIMTVGIDGLGIERNQPEHETHWLLLSSSITVIEGLRLGGVDQGTYFLCCLPLLLDGLDAAPARAILMRK